MRICGTPVLTRPADGNGCNVLRLQIKFRLGLASPFTSLNTYNYCPGQSESDPVRGCPANEAARARVMIGSFGCTGQVTCCPNYSILGMEKSAHCPEESQRQQRLVSYLVL